ncbi:nucleoporin NUP42-like isoform X1 [Paramormyrops kingsleyae]|uniref:Nucleoporin NUP42 n=1 Tax=Paramormyrops kingsleyae TaxID=1676925 RepID=A0A3B3QK03_9TELE|nr:nucleoporin-like protein 2 isoform X1 [Paramormyrops kingsleyae]
MTVCNFFLQGRCRYGERCWNEHPQSGGGGYNNNRGQQSSSYRGGGYGNKVWVNPSQRSGRDYVAPPSFARGGNDWGRGGGGGGGGGERDIKASGFSFTAHNRFTALDTQQTFDHSGQDENDKLLETIKKDMESWESSGQWPLSCYSAQKASISGFSELSPDELRLEYYKCRESGSLQTYAASVQQLFSQWSNRVQELKILNSDSRAQLISELNNPDPQPSSVSFASTAPTFTKAAGFGAVSSDINSFSFKASSSGFGSADTQRSPSGFGATSLAPTGFGFSDSGPSTAPSASSFSFAAPVLTDKEKPTGIGGAVNVSEFSFSLPSVGNVFVSKGDSSFAQPSGTIGAKGPAPTVGGAVSMTGKLYTPQSELTAEELKEFAGKRFTLGEIPLRPPPADMLVV